MSQLDPQYLADLRAGCRTCGDPLCPEPHCWMERPDCETCCDSGVVPHTGRGSDGYDPCPDCAPDGAA